MSQMWYSSRMKFTTTIPLSLYIHIPWCVRKCPYCDFNSHAMRDGFPETDYVAALINDLDMQLPRIEGRQIVSIFFGGGTPSLFSPEAIEKILTGVCQRLSFAPNIEITLEANPGTVDEKRFSGFRRAGINRLSIGIQSLQDEKLKALGRIHLGDDARRAIDTAKKVGFDNFNLDFMHGLPGQTITDALYDLQDALSFAPPHLSWYQLTIEPNTFFHFQPPQLPPDETLWEIQEQGNETLNRAGLFSYEISAFAKKNHECKHNQNYWQFGDYLGIGAGAHSKITDFEKNIVVRHSQIKNPRDYLNSEKRLIINEQIVSTDDICFEFMMNALRLTNGVPANLFIERTGLPLSTIKNKLSYAKEKKWMIDDENTLAATTFGQRFLNDVIGLFLP